ncbi:MAG: hypothetical protein GTN80_09150, partial [Nitrososphaeria archaeon]|nr:hypothetical protein [Nitrososphaeria archaeon]
VRLKPIRFSIEEKERIVEMMSIFSKNYLQELYGMLDYVTEVAAYVPNQRERILEISEVSYYRSIRNIEAMFGAYQNRRDAAEISQLPLERFGSLPRAIKLSAVLYSLGLPPELLGVGNAIVEIKSQLGQKWVDHLLDRIYPSLEDDIKFSSRFYHPSKFESKRISRGLKILKSLVPFEPPSEIHESLSKIATHLITKTGLPGKVTPRDLKAQLTRGESSEYIIGTTDTDLSKIILDMGKIRRSLG